MNETTENVEFVEGVLASALTTALRDLAGRGINLWVWEGGKPSKITVQKQLTLLCGDTRAEGFAAPENEHYVWKVKTYSQPATEELDNAPHIFKYYIEKVTSALFNKLELTSDTVIFSAYPVFELLRDDPLVWARMRIRLEYLNVPVEIAHQLARTNDKIKPLDLDAPLTHRK